LSQLEDIARLLAARKPAAGGGDHALNPGMTVEPPFRAAAVLILLIPRADGLTVLFTERTTTLSAHAGQVSFPGGGVDPEDADDIAAALREAQEEIGLDPGNARVLGVLDEYITRTGFAVKPVVAVLEKNQDWVPSPDEVAHIFEVPLDHILSAGVLEKCAVSFEGRTRHFYALEWDGFRIWGATAGMLRHFADIIGNGGSGPAPEKMAEAEKERGGDNGKKGAPPANKP
jgi:8-oxo-dGTP pyrophosphatase MutT (NUDIX family)